MVARSLGKVAARLTEAVKPFTSKDNAKEFARTLKAEYEAGKASATDDDERTVLAALRDVDWAAVRAATAERTTEAAQKMRAMAGEVDWGKVQPVAAHVSSALIAAVASGQMPLGGRVGPTVARAIMNDHNLAQRVATSLRHEDAPLPPDFRGELGHVIDTTATE